MAGLVSPAGVWINRGRYSRQADGPAALCSRSAGRRHQQRRATHAAVTPVDMFNSEHGAMTPDNASSASRHDINGITQLVTGPDAVSLSVCQAVCHRRRTLFTPRRMDGTSKDGTRGVASQNKLWGLNR